MYSFERTQNYVLGVRFSAYFTLRGPGVVERAATITQIFFRKFGNKRTVQTAQCCRSNLLYFPTRNGQITHNYLKLPTDTKYGKYSTPFEVFVSVHSFSTLCVLYSRPRQTRALEHYQYIAKQTN